MKKVKRVLNPLLFILLFLLGACSDSCNLIETTVSNYETYTSSVIVFADGCNSESGSTSQSRSTTPEPTGVCDGSENGYVNRGRWVKVPSITAKDGSSLSIDVYGNIFYCSTGYDNKNTPPRIAVQAIPDVQTVFEDGSEVPVKGGQQIVLDIADIGTVALNDNPSLPDCDSNQYYSSFVNGSCKTNGGRGLSIYVKNNTDDLITEIVTLDNTTQDFDTSESIYQLNTSRFPNLYSPYIAQAEQETFFSYINTKYSKDVEPAGPNRYVFLVPEGLEGVLGFNIAQGREGTGEYSVEVKSTPPGCMVEKSIIKEDENPGERGALMVLVEDTDLNPNDIDNVLSTFDAYDSDISEYYPELVNYMASRIGVDLSVFQDKAILEDMKVSSVGTSSLDPYVMLTANFDGNSNNDGNIWLKVKDDYYHDNIGQYEVELRVTSKKQSLVSDFLNDITTPVFNSLDRTSKIIYESFAADIRFQNIMKMSLMIYIMIWGAQFILGLSSTTARDAVVRMLKIAVVIQLFNTNSWDFFNEYFFKLFTEGKDFLITAVTGDNSSDRSGIFGFVDDVFYIFFSAETWKKFLALIPSLIGLVYMFMFITVICIYLVALSEAFIVYLITITVISLLLSIAPMFFVAALFERTKKLFFNWIKALTDYAMQPVVLFAVLYVVNQLFMTFWNNATDYDVCYGGVWKIWFWGVEAWTYQVIPAFYVGHVHFYNVYGDFQGYEMFMEIMILYIFAATSRSILAHTPTITEGILGSSSATKIYHAAQGALKSMQNTLSGGDPVERNKERKALDIKDKKEVESNKEIGQKIQDAKNGLKNAREKAVGAKDKAKEGINTLKERAKGLANKFNEAMNKKSAGNTPEKKDDAKPSDEEK
jgi:type IV secretory pathway VirB6-like protein